MNTVSIHHGRDTHLYIYLCMHKNHNHLIIVIVLYLDCMLSYKVLMGQNWLKLGVFHANQISMCLIHIWYKGEVGAVPLNRFKPSSKIFYWPFQGGTSFVDLLCFCLSCVCYVFARVCIYVLCGHLLGKGWPLGSRLWCLTVSLSLSHWYPGSGVILDCIDSWSLHPYLLLLCYISE